ncbi:hypothetical protein SPI_00631 [Niveomyces insectorum RCEF 264]|uniref:Uncharacterized protein n=1 Tax=Niveomyces insectorum RCEF 264 TaxID=1081102 RepID=A0A168A9I2_9HYPO|nr:hypothetical protein SPI_00631 [Niveomyces insectorum RCEF 264]
MTPGTVRTVPPWVIQRPPPSLLSQHNHAPSNPRDRARAPSDEPGSEARHDNGGGGGSGSGRGSSQHHTTATSTSEGSETKAERAIAATSGSERRLGPRLSHLFKNKEGRKWDHLRSSEPVIVSQFHVVNGPTTTTSGRDERHSVGRRKGPREVDEDDGGERPGGEGKEEGGGGGEGGEAERQRGRTATTAAVTPQRHDATAAARTASSPYADAAAAAPPATAGPSWWYNPETQWRAFIESSRYPHLPNEKSEILDDEEMSRLHPDFGYNFALQPKTGGAAAAAAATGDVPRRGRFRRRLGYLSDKAFYQRLWQTILHHPLSPLVCRLTVLSTSIVALVVAVEIFRREKLGSHRTYSSTGGGGGGDATSLLMENRRQERTQIIVAIVVDVVAVPYIGYITVDDYTGKPLGLRPPQSRIRLILADLFFIIFKSASTALGFETMIYFNSPDSQGLLTALGVFELVGLISWALTLTINVFREVERLGG